MFTVRKEHCVNCGAEFEISLEEFIYKLDHGMRLPKRCRACRRRNRAYPDPYKGLQAVRASYPATKGRRHSVHGGHFS